MQIGGTPCVIGITICPFPLASDPFVSPYSHDGLPHLGIVAPWVLHRYMYVVVKLVMTHPTIKSSRFESYSLCTFRNHVFSLRRDVVVTFAGENNAEISSTL